jgi:hypothetical protein
LLYLPVKLQVGWGAPLLVVLIVNDLIFLKRLLLYVSYISLIYLGGRRRRRRRKNSLSRLGPEQGGQGWNIPVREIPHCDIYIYI